MPYINGGSGATLSGVTVSGAAAAGKVPVASNATTGAWAFPPGFEFGYDQITAPVSITSTTEATGTTVIACAAHVFDGGPVIAEFFSPISDPPATNSDYVISLFEGATQLGRLWHSFASNVTYMGQVGILRFTPTAASHTYTVTAYHSGATNPQVDAGAGGTGANVPAFIRFTKV